MSLTGQRRDKHHEYGLVLAFICIVLALALAKYSRQQSLVGLHSSVLSSADGTG